MVDYWADMRAHQLDLKRVESMERKMAALMVVMKAE
jgi:hypothetical protein